MGVAVEQPRQQVAAADVHGLVAVQAGPDLQDAAVLDDHVGVGRRGAGAVEDPPAGQQRPGHGPGLKFNAA
jgi:hypothetical protein